jgi:hypothetical protein
MKRFASSSTSGSRPLSKLETKMSLQMTKSKIPIHFLQRLNGLENKEVYAG